MIRYALICEHEHAFEGWFGASVAHVVSRTVRDTALFLDAGQGHEAGSPYWTQPLQRSFVEALGHEPGRLRIALVQPRLDIGLRQEVEEGRDALVVGRRVAGEHP